jgi:hypothetical protein
LYNELEEDDPRVILYQTHPLIASDIRELGVFLDRYDTNKEVHLSRNERKKCH